MKEALTISTDRANGNTDFDFLRQEAIKILQTLGGEAWTDHNRHDPGITILEQLCYAISDLCYRISFDVPDILANSKDGLSGLHTPYEVLTGNPVTLADLRKIVLDVPGVRNAWIEPRSFKVSYRREDQSLGEAARPDTGITDIRGLYSIAVEVAEEKLGSSVEALVRMRTQACRPIGEDFTDIIILKEQPVTIKAMLEIGEVEDPEGFLASVYQALDEALSPTPRFFTLQEMIQQGYALEDIMTGPKLVHGFLKDEDAGVARKPAIFTSDLIRVLHSIPGLLVVRSIQLDSRNQVKDWKITIDPDRVPKLSMNLGSGVAGKGIELFRNGVRLPVDDQLVETRFREIRARNEKKVLSRNQLDLIPAKKTTRHIDLYHSMQNHFPEIYALAEGSLSANASPARKAQQAQLRAYLLFFDQVLASYHAQLGHLHDLFAFSTGNGYAEQVPGDVPELSSVIPKMRSYQDQLSALFRADGEKNKQRSKSLNHLMARFAEDFTQFSMLVVDTRQRKDFENRCKVNLLKDYPGISGDRSRASNSMQAVDRSGLEKRILLKLGLPVDGSRFFYLVEHILLRPTADDRFQSPAFMKLATEGALPAANEIDPFSLQITYVFPVFTARKIAKRVIELVLREETPAHIQAGIVWLPECYHLFPEIHSSWRSEMENNFFSPSEPRNPFKLRALRNWLIDFLEIGKTYPISDLPLAPPRIVPFETPGSVEIPYSELGVTYQLVSKTYSSPKVDGIGAAIDLYTNPLSEDTEFTVFAEKAGSLLKVPLQTKLLFKVGIDVVLQTSVVQNMLLPYNTSATLVINDSQEEVGYKLFDAEGNAISMEVRGNGGKISITTSPFREDGVMVLKASKTFDDANSEIVMIEETPITVHPDAAIAVSTRNVIPNVTAPEPVISLKNTQRSVSYRAYVKAFDENDIIYEGKPAGDDIWSLSYNADGIASRNIVVRDPASLPFIESTSVQGTGGDLNIKLPALENDLIVFIMATKVRGDEIDSLRLTDKPVILRMPQTVTWEAPAQVSKGTVATIRIVNPQRGVTYQLVNAADGSVAGVPVHFHKNKPIEAGRVGADFAVDAIDEVMLLTLPLQADSQFKINAIRHYTGVALLMADDITIRVS